MKSGECKRKWKQNDAKIKIYIYTKKGILLFYQTADLLKHYIFMTFRVDQKLRFLSIIKWCHTWIFKTGVTEIIVDIPLRIRGQLMCETTRIFLTSQVVQRPFLLYETSFICPALIIYPLVTLLGWKFVIYGSIHFLRLWQQETLSAYTLSTERKENQSLRACRMDLQTEKKVTGKTV